MSADLGNGVLWIPASSMTRGALLIIILLVLISLAGASDNVVHFRGSKVQNSRLGILIMPDAKKDIIAVTSPLRHFGLILPYSEEWEFTGDEQFLLKGKAGIIDLTLEMRRSDQEPRAFLESVRQSLVSRGATKGLKKAEIIIFKDIPVLRAEMDVEIETGSDRLRNEKRISFWVVKQWEDTLYTLHLSQRVDLKNPKGFDETAFMNYVAVGFHVDFLR
ncbi:MAG: hypothetical protein ACM34I_09265 [bacterium]